MSKETDISTSVSPLSAADFSSFIQPFTLLLHKPTLGVAVSGGPDSMALAFCLNRWALQKNKKIIAFIVNHGLRKEAANEALVVQERLEKIGISSEILVWNHPPITNRIHVLAREARYALLTDACKQHQIDCLFLGHQKEDQAETILMRMTKGSGIVGLAGMAAHTEREEIHLLRPLLDVKKEQLQQTCLAAGIDYVTDPSNLSEKYERGRLRKLMPELEQQGLTIDSLVALGKEAEKARQALTEASTIFLQTYGKTEFTGVLHLKAQAYDELPTPLKQHILTLCLQQVHQKIYAPEQATLASLIQALGASPSLAGRTLHGCLVSKNSNYITFIREAAQIQDEQFLFPGKEILWDGKWKVSLSRDYPTPLTVRALGLQEHAVLDKFDPKLRKRIPQGRVRATLPALWQGDNLMLIPAFAPTQDTGMAQALLSTRKK